MNLLAKSQQPDTQLPKRKVKPAYDRANSDRLGCLV